MGWKVGWHEGQASNQNSCTLNFPLLEKLVQRARCKNAQEAVELEHDLVNSRPPRQEQYREIEGFCKGGGVSGRSFVSIDVDMKGQGFESCLLDVTTLPCGQYQLSFHCVGLDTRNRPWVLLASNIRSCLKIIPPGQKISIHVECQLHEFQGYQHLVTRFSQAPEPQVFQS